MRWIRVAAVVVWLVATTLLAARARGSLGQIVLLVMSTFAALGCWGVGGLLALFAGRGPSRRRDASRAALVPGAFFLGTWASLPFGMMLNRRDVTRAMEFCKGLVPAIERYKAETGCYPDVPPGTGEDASWPRLLDRRTFFLFYEADAEGYWFAFVDPAGLMSGFQYGSRLGRWRGWSMWPETVIYESDAPGELAGRGGERLN